MCDKKIVKGCDVEQVLLPQTSIEKYLTAITALNVPDDEMETGDWHISTTFNPGFGRTPSFSVSNEYVDTNHIFGTDSILERSDILRRFGINIGSVLVYSANHYRAIADMVFKSLSLNRPFENAIILDDWLPMDEHKQRFFNLFENAKPYFSGEQWNRYLSWKNNS